MNEKERIKKAKREIDMLWNEAVYWSEREGEDSEQARCWASRWVASSDMFFILTGERYLSK